MPCAAGRERGRFKQAWRQNNIFKRYNLVASRRQIGHSRRRNGSL